MSWKLKSLDINTALLQKQTIDRTIHVLPPPGTIHVLPPPQALWKLRKCIYGLADAPRCFYTHLQEVLSELNVYPNSLDEGLFFAKSKTTGELIGIIACHVDDLLFGGTDEFHLQVIKPLRVALEFGTENSGAFTFIGMHVTQHTEMSITLDQLTFAASISPIELSPGHQQTKKAHLTDEERTQFCVTIGQFNWLATVSHPEISFDVCQASSRVWDAAVSDMFEVNKVIYKVKKEQAYIHFPKLTLSSVHLRVYSDASFNNLPDGSSKEGFLVLISDSSNKCSPISWPSNCIKGVVRSTLAAETLALNDGCDTAFFASKLSCSILSSVGTELRIVAVTDNQSAVDAIRFSSLISDRRLHAEMSALCQYQASLQVDFQQWQRHTSTEWCSN